MNSTQLAQQAYAPSGGAIRTGRANEYLVFTQITARLAKFRDARGSDFRHLASALYDNRRLWTLLAAEVAEASNALPDDLRARIFYLAEFTQHHSRLVLSGKAGVEPLIEINSAVADGLGDGGTRR